MTVMRQHFVHLYMNYLSIWLLVFTQRPRWPFNWEYSAHSQLWIGQAWSLLCNSEFHGLNPSFNGLRRRRTWALAKAWREIQFLFADSSESNQYQSNIHASKYISRFYSKSFCMYTKNNCPFREQCLPTPAHPYTLTPIHPHTY